MIGEAVLSKRRTWWRNRAAVLLAFATMLTQLAFLPGTLASAGAQELLTASACVGVDDIDDVVANVRSALAAGTDVALPPGNYYLLDGPLVLAGDADLSGTGGTAADTVVDGCGLDRVVDVASAATSTITNVTLIGGDTNGNDRGGGVRVQSGADVELIDLYVVDNSAYEGGGLYNEGTTTVESSTFESNVASQKGGGIENDGLLIMVNSTLSNNTGKGGGGLSTAGTALLSYSTIYQNVSTNKIGAGTLRNGGTLSIVNSIVAQNIGSDGDFHDCSGTPDVDNVLFSSTQGCNPAGAYIIDLTELDALTFTTGRTPTHPLPSEDHAAVDAQGFIGPPDMFNESIDCRVLPDLGAGPLLEVDQRGVTRSTPCDVGAHEFGDPLTLDIALDTSVNQIEVGAVVVPINNILTANTEAPSEDDSTSSTPLGAIPLGAIPLGAIPLGAIPLGAIPLGAIPLGAIPLGAIPLGAIPLGAIPLLSELTLTDAGFGGLVDTDTEGAGIGLLLIGTDLEGTPVVALNITDLLEIELDEIDYAATDANGNVNPIGGIVLGDVPDPEAVSTGCADQAATIADLASGVPCSLNAGATVGDALSFDDVSLAATPLGAIPLGAIAFGSTPLGAIPLGAISEPPQNDIDAWCSFIDCAAFGITPGDDNGVSLMTLALAGVPLGAIPLGAIPLGAIPLGAIPLGAIPLGAISWESTPLGAIPLGAIPLGAIPLGAIPLGAIPLGAIPLGAIGLADVPLGAIPLGAIPLGAISGDELAALNLLCDGGFCDGTTIADADFLPGVTLSELAEALGDFAAFADLQGWVDFDAITLEELASNLAELVLLADLEGWDFAEFTFLDLLYGLLGPENVPWHQIDIETARFPDAADPKQPSFDAEIELDVGGDFDADVVLKLTLPEGFLYAKDLPNPAIASDDHAPVRVDGAPGPDAVEQPDGTVELQLNGLSPGVHNIDIAVRAGIVIGEDFELSVEADGVPAGGGDPGDCDEASPPASCESAGPATAAIDVIEAASGDGDGPASAPVLQYGIGNEAVQLAHVRSNEFFDLFKFEIPSGQVGVSARLLLSHVPEGEDYDLVLYGPPSGVGLRGEPVQGFDGVEDFLYDLTLDDEVLDTETLEDVPHDPVTVGLGAENVLLYGVSSKRDNNDEAINTGTLVPGTYYVQVSAYNGSFSNHPYLLRLRVNGVDAPQCTVDGFDYAGAAHTPAALPASIGATTNTIFLYNHRRLLGETWGSVAGSAVLAELPGGSDGNDWAADGVVGAVIAIDGAAPAGSGADVLTELIELNASPDSLCDPQEANDVVREIGDLLDYYITNGTADPSDDRPVENIVLIGDDSQIPFARIPDGTFISNERVHGATFADLNETVGALVSGFILSDDPYGTDFAIAVNNHELFVPNRAVGRLVEHPDDIAQALENFVTFNGFLDPSTTSTDGLVTGYDFLTDGAEAVVDNLKGDPADAKYDVPPPNTLISENWARVDLEALLGQDFLVASVNAHFDQNRALPALGNLTGDESDLFEVPNLPSFIGRLLFSMGCHSGLSLSDVQIGAPTGTDWAQALGENSNLWLANTGFGYGDTILVALSEALSAAFADHLGTGDGISEVTTGAAWVAAKNEVASGLPVIDPYHEKILQEWVFFGLPMYRTGVLGSSANAAFELVGETSGGSGVKPLAVFAEALASMYFFPGLGSGLPTETDPDTGLEVGVAQFSLAIGDPAAAPPLNASGPGVLFPNTVPDGVYWDVDGETLNVNGRPIQPLTGQDVTAPDGTGGLDLWAAGALITDLTGIQQATNPVYFNAVPSLGDGGNDVNVLASQAWEPEVADATFPAGLQKIITYQDAEGQTRQRLLFVPGRFVSDGVADVGAQELFTHMVADVYFRDPAETDFVAPFIRESIGWHSMDRDIIFFDIEVIGEGPVGGDDTDRVYVMFRRQDLSPTEWTGLDLERVPGTNRWVGGRPTGTTDPVMFEFFVQAKDVHGNVGVAAAKGEYFLSDIPPNLAGLVLDVDPPPNGAGWHNTDVTVTDVIGTAASYRLDTGPSTPWPAGGVGSELLITTDGGHFLEVTGTSGEFEALFIAIDKTPPVVQTSVDPPTATGWYTENPDVTISASDALSGVKSITWSYHLGGDGNPDTSMSGAEVPGDEVVVQLSETFPTVYYIATDVADNVARDGAVAFEEMLQIDTTDPSISITLPDPSDPLNNTLTDPAGPLAYEMDTSAAAAALTESFSCDYGTSGPGTCVSTGDDFDITTPGGGTITIVGTDAAGNSDSVSVVYTVADTTAPVLTATLSVTPTGTFQNGWYSPDVRITVIANAGAGTSIDSTGIECSADNSTFGPCSGFGTVDASSTTTSLILDVTGDGANQKLYFRASDTAANTGSTSATFSIDGTAPTLTWVFLDAPGGNPVTQPFSLGQVVYVDFTCTDSHSGIATCPADQQLDTTSAGTKSIPVTATDVAGNSTNDNVVYAVAFGVCLQYDPTKETPGTGTVPIKLQLCSFGPDGLPNTADDVNLSTKDLILTAIGVQLADGSVVYLPGPNDTGNANADFEFRFRANIEGYIFNLNVDEVFRINNDDELEQVSLDPTLDNPGVPDATFYNPYQLLFVVTDAPITTFDQFGFPDPDPALVRYAADFTLK